MKPKVLYIDDELNCLISFKACFREHFRVFTALSASDAMDILKENYNEENHDENIQVIVSDQRMPHTTGSKFFESIVKNYPDIVRILLTGYSDISDIVDAVNKGRIFSYHSKPIIEDDLLLDIQKACKVYEYQIKKKLLTKNLEDVNRQLEFLIRQGLLS